MIVELARYEFEVLGRIDHAPPALTWDYLSASPGDLAVVSCSSGHVTRMVERVHRVDQDGTVHPSYVCTVPGCGFHAFVRLVGWGSGARCTA